MIVNKSISVFIVSFRRKFPLVFVLVGLLKQPVLQAAYVPQDVRLVQTKTDSLGLNSKAVALTDTVKIHQTNIFTCKIEVINHSGITIDYIIVSDTSIVFCIGHTLSRDSIQFQSYTLRSIQCTNRTSLDTVNSYQSNMLLAQDKRVYAGAPDSYYLRFPMKLSMGDTLELTQAADKGPLQFPGIALSSLTRIDSLPPKRYLTEIMTGTAAFYSRQKLGKLDVYLDDEFIGTIDESISKKAPIPDCGEIDETLVNRRVTVGKHTYYVTNGKYAWEGDFIMLREGCVRINIEK